MAATVAVMIDRGGSDGTPDSNVDVTSGGIKFRTDDSPDTIDNTNPIPKPTAGNKYSFWISCYLLVTGGTFSSVSNVKWYTGGGNLYSDAGVDLFVADETPTKNSGSDAGYEVADGTVGDTGDELAANHSLVTGVTDASTYTAAAVKDVSISEDGGAIDAAGESSDYVVLQSRVGTTATAGDKSAETLTFRYDET